MIVRPRNEQCPRRPAGLWHQTVPYGTTCYMCGALTFEAPTVRLVAVMPPCPSCGNPKQDRAAILCNDCAIQRRLEFQQLRYATGRLTEEAYFAPLVPSQQPARPYGAGSLDDWNPDTIAKAVGK